jgi:hypothetical protein
LQRKSPALAGLFVAAINLGLGLDFETPGTISLDGLFSFFWQSSRCKNSIATQEASGHDFSRAEKILKNKGLYRLRKNTIRREAGVSTPA